MTAAGWLLLTTALVFVWGLAGWCYYRVLILPPRDAPQTSARERRPVGN